MADGSSVVADIGSMLRTIASIDVDRLNDCDLPGAVLEAEQFLNAANALSAALLERLEHSGVWRADGALSAAAWVATRTGSAKVGVRNRLRQGAALRGLPTVAVEARSGRLSVDHLRSLAECSRHSERVAADENMLLEQAGTLGADSFRAVTRAWLEHAGDVTSAEPAESAVRVHEASRLHASRTFEGWLRLDGWLAPQDADLVEAALGAGVDRALRQALDGDPTVAGQHASALRAMALVDLVAQSMRREPTDASVPDRYRVAVVVRRGDPTVPREAACDSTAYRAVLGASGEVLDIGRQTSRWPVAVRRAITIRDRGCTFPGCDRPPSWCDIHHCRPWKEGGTTSVDNGVLLCRLHHTFAHQYHWHIMMDNGLPTFRRPDGTPYIIQRWQPDARSS
jgi:HNH endonuclease